MPKKRRNIGSSKKGFCTRTRVFELMLTTAGVTCSSIGASDGSASPSIAGGNAASAHGMRLASARLSARAVVFGRGRRVRSIGSGLVLGRKGCARDRENVRRFQRARGDRKSVV